MKSIEKAYAISDAKIRFVSLVDKAANKKRFLITKAEGGSAAFQSFGRILKADVDSHFVTGIVYEPMAEDTDGNYMTAAEIEKAAHWFMKHGGDVDIQHCFEKAKGVDVVESFVAKGDMEIEGQRIAKGTWIMTMEVSDDGVWDAIAKGDITGFSMGGAGCFSSEDVDLGRVEKRAGVKGLLVSDDRRVSWKKRQNRRCSHLAAGWKRLGKTRDTEITAQKMLQYNKAAGKELSGLMERRKKEQTLFLKSTAQNVQAASTQSTPQDAASKERSMRR